MQETTEKKKPGIIRRFFAGIWFGLTWLRITVLNLLFLAIVLMFFAAIQTEKTVPLTESTALRVAPNGFLVDQRSFVDPMTQLLDGTRPEERETLVLDLVRTIENASTDSRITALVLDLNNFHGGGISKLEEVGQALDQFKDSGKPLIAMAGNYSQARYYLASYADEIILNPMGSVILTGYSSYRQYYKTALDKLAFNFHVFRVGTYKDFIEPYTRDNMSEASREHNRRWLDDLWAVYTGRVEQLRGLPNNAIDNYINNLDVKLAEAAGDSAQLALDSGLVDKLLTQTELRAQLVQRFGEDRQSHQAKTLDYWDYLKFLNEETPVHRDKVALIVASGVIVAGDHPEGTIGSDSVSALLAKTRDRKDVKALVLRVDSGGGGVFASDVIYHELKLTREAGIPVFISMGSVAASGGYWISTASDEIWATPTTITGSIGVFGAFPTLEKTFAKLGIHTDGVGTTALAGDMRLDRDLSPIANSVIQQGVEFSYRQFIQLVANARGKSMDDVHQIAQGQVWSGKRAKEMGLVDHLGNLNDVIAAAAAHADLDNYSVEVIRKTLSPKEQFLQQLSGGGLALVPSSLIDSFAPIALRQSLAPVIEPFLNMSNMTDPRGVYAQCSGCKAP